MLNLLSFASLLFSCYMLICILDLTDIKNIVLASFCFAVGFVSVWGYILSAFDVLGQLSAWMNISLITSLILVIVARVQGARLSVVSLVIAMKAVFRKMSNTFIEQTVFTKSALLLLAIFSIIAGILNFLLGVIVPPIPGMRLLFIFPAWRNSFKTITLSLFILRIGHR